jgi:hypothetical protein
MTECPMEVLGYATRHGYDDIRDEVAPLTLDFSFNHAQTYLSMDALLAWVPSFNHLQTPKFSLTLT